MTTAVLPLPAHANAGDRDLRIACRRPDTDQDFFGAGPAAETRARAVCLGCPVLVQCLRKRSLVDLDSDVWGVLGGLSADQRRALSVAEQLGERPELRTARTLLTPRWRYRLHNLRVSGQTPERIAQVLRQEGLELNPVTVRVAVWWSGGAGGLMARRARGDQRPLWKRVRDDHADVILQLRNRGTRQVDIAAYLGVHINTYVRAIQSLEARRTEASRSADQMAFDAFGAAA
ncbi:WhiB family transcriptional regulator [Streptomyces sp. NPDC001404]|uniref:WhiB family transcriptional regulator n=1 Tax=Streptomyces sp. NPDC001404 TaxID=3364571 RepID=UPI0036AA0882